MEEEERELEINFDKLMEILKEENFPEDFQYVIEENFWELLL